MIKRLRKHIIPSPSALTAVWIGLGILFTLTLIGLLFSINQPDGLFSFLLVLSIMALPGSALLWLVAAWVESKAASRAVLWGGITLIMGLAVIIFSASMYLVEITQQGGPSVWWFFGCCASPLFLIPGGLTLFFAMKSWSQLREALKADRAQRTLELLSARGEATFAEIGSELGLPEDQIENLLNEWKKSGRLAIIIDSPNRRVLTLLALFEKKRRLDAVIQARGQIHLVDIAHELHVPRDLLDEWIRSFVKRNKFTGFVDWDTGLLSSLEAEQLKDQKHCPQCGGDTNLAGKGLIRCSYCGVEIFLARESQVSSPKEIPQKINASDYDREKMPALFYGEPRLSKAAAQRSPIRRLGQLFMPNKRTLSLLIITLLMYLSCSSCSLLYFEIQEEWRGAVISILATQGVFIIPLAALLLLIAAWLDKHNPVRVLISLIAMIIVGLGSLLVVVMMSFDSEAGLSMGIDSLVVIGIPLVLIFSLPVIYFGLKSWPEVQAVLRLQTSQRVLHLIDESGAIRFEEIAQKLVIPLGEVDNLVDELLRLGELYGTMDGQRGWVYTAQHLEEKRTQLLEVLHTQGQIQFEELTRQLHIPPDLLRDLIYQLVQLHQFSGYINWEEGQLYSIAAEKLGSESQCPQCGGRLGLEGQIIECQHCGSEILRG